MLPYMLTLTVLTLGKCESKPPDFHSHNNTKQIRRIVKCPKSLFFLGQYSILHTAEQSKRISLHLSWELLEIARRLCSVGGAHLIYLYIFYFLFFFRNTTSCWRFCFGCHFLWHDWWHYTPRRSSSNGRWLKHCVRALSLVIFGSAHWV